MPVNVCPDDIFWTAEPSVTDLGMMKHYQEFKCHVKRLVCFLQGHGLVTVKSYILKIWPSPFSSELLVLLIPHLVWWYMIVSRSVLWKDWIAVFKVKVTAKIHSFNACPDEIFETAERFFNQTWYGDASSLAGDALWKNLVCNLHGQGHNEGSYNQVWMSPPYLLDCWSFCSHI